MKFTYDVHGKLKYISPASVVLILLPMMLTPSVKADFTKNVPGSAITLMPSSGKYLSRASFTALAI